MGVFRAIGRFIAFLWDVSKRSWVKVHPDLRPRSGASALYLFLILFFFCIGLILVMLGFDLNDVDLWLEAHGGIFAAIGMLLFRLFWAVVLFFALFFVGYAVYDLRNGKFRIGMALSGLIIGYFAWFGVTAEL